MKFSVAPRGVYADRCVFEFLACRERVVKGIRSVVPFCIVCLGSVAAALLA